MFRKYQKVNKRVSTFLNNPYCLSLLSGGLLYLSFPGGGEISLLLLFALLPLLKAFSQVGRKDAFICGLLAGMVHFSSLMYWIVTVLGKYGGLPWYIAVVALLLLALYMALYMGLFAFMARWMLQNLPPFAALWLIPALWVGLDWFRGMFLTGLPWMDLGYALYHFPLLIQIADILGHHGLSYLIVFVNILVWLLLSNRRTLSGYLGLLLPSLCLLTGVMVYSILRFDGLSQKIDSYSSLKIRAGIVQGNIDQTEKWSPEKQDATVNSYLSLTKSITKSGKPMLVVWPETALPFYPPGNKHMVNLDALVKNENIGLLTGAPWYKIIDREARKVLFYNSALMLKGDGKIGDKYFKNHLVPFGEYVPLKKFLPFLAPLVEAVGDFSPGTIEKTIGWKDADLGVLICFESVFPSLSRQWVLAGADILVNLTNDAWYGKSSAPYHSLAMSVFRAVETRRTVVRSANTGISAFIDPKGSIIRQSPLFQSWAATTEVVLMEETTFWVKYGYLFGPFCLLITLFVAIVVGRRRKAVL